MNQPISLSLHRILPLFLFLFRIDKIVFELFSSTGSLQLILFSLPPLSLSLLRKNRRIFSTGIPAPVLFSTMEKTMVEKRLGTESKNSKKRVIFLDRADRQSFFFFFFLLSNTYSYSVTLYIYFLRLMSVKFLFFEEFSRT